MVEWSVSRWSDSVDEKDERCTFDQGPRDVTSFFFKLNKSVHSYIYNTKTKTKTVYYYLLLARTILPPSSFKPLAFRWISCPKV